jgi:hypothetical protein
VRCLSPIVTRRSDENSSPPRHLAVRAPRWRRLCRHALSRDSKQAAWSTIPRDMQASANPGQHPACLHIYQALVTLTEHCTCSRALTLTYGSRRRHRKRRARAVMTGVATRAGNVLPFDIRLHPVLRARTSALYRINRRLTIEHPGDIGCGLGLQLS